MTRLFVYGTLKRGHERQSAMSGQELLGSCFTQPDYRLVHCGSYPGLIESSEGIAVWGEVYGVSAERLGLLDEIEGVESGLYERRRIRLQSPFQAIHVQAYFYLADCSGLPDCGDRW